MESNKKNCKKNKLIVIEDSADTLGAKINNNPTGKYSDCAITSFYGSHVISCAGNGGMLMLKKKSDYEKARILRSWGRLSSILTDSESIKKRLNIKDFDNLNTELFVGFIDFTLKNWRELD